MKYRVKYKCYWYNTGAGDNHYYTETKDFDSPEDAINFKGRVDEQFDMNRKFERNVISFSDYNKWQKTFDMIEIENGFIDSNATIVTVSLEVEGGFNGVF